ncbi:MAG: CoB--CoM heterodisulfide reductase iron-sulfur subunit A family protein [Defluviitaleaceae bacterium]|nr:CoB--CoM heterodisulfide reductase iron-sulfur subunit A family protein [Defluviitaleaceae bacterium]
MNDVRIGVFVCHCGSNIGGVVDCKAVAEYASKLPNVTVALDYSYMCSDPGQKLIKDNVKEHGLNRLVVASCSPRMHEPTFRTVTAESGLNPYYMQMANIREQVSWVTNDADAATEKAKDLVRAAVGRVVHNQAVVEQEIDIEKTALVIGGGVAGIEAALTIARGGYKTYLVEKSPTIGGVMAQLDKTFPTLDCSACILTPKMVDAAQHENITLYTYSEVEKVAGYVGNFSVKIRRKAGYVNHDLCTGCGDCMEKCPAKKIPNAFDENMSNRTAIYIPFPQAIPNKPVIDTAHCIYFKTGKCGLCKRICSLKAIDFEQQDEYIQQEYGVIVAAIGFQPLSPTMYGEYLYGQSPDVLTSLEFERLMNAAGPTGGQMIRPSTGEKPKSIVFIQCVGSRADANDPRGKTYCSKICCMYTAKHAMLVRDKYPDIDVTVFYIDVRTPGKNFDEFYRRAVEQYDVQYIKGMVGKIADEGGRLQVMASDLLEGGRLTLEVDMVVLATAVEASPHVRGLATMLTASMNQDNFFSEAHPKLRPVESPTAGILLSGACQGPKDIPETVAQAGAAAVKALGILSKNKLMGNPCIASPNELLCNGCSQCAKVCPYKAIDYVDREIKDHGTCSVRRLSQVNEALCQGCGACTVACPSGAMDLRGFTSRQIMAEVDAICR